MMQYGNTKPFSNNTFKNYTNSLTYLKSVIYQVKRSLPSGEGIDNLLNYIESESILPEAVISFENIKDLDNANLQHIVFIYEYMSNPVIFQIIKDTDLNEPFYAVTEKLKTFGEKL